MLEGRLQALGRRLLEVSEHVVHAADVRAGVSLDDLVRAAPAGFVVA
jgi:hypothetical protein